MGPTEVDPFRAALDAFQRGDMDRARSLAEQAIAADPTAQAHHLLGLACCRLGDAAAGVDHLRRAADSEPGNAGFALMLARALIDCGRPGEVLALAEPPLGPAPETLALWHARAEAAELAHDHGALAASWAAIADLRPADPGNRVQLGRALLRADDHDGAETAYRRALAIAPSSLGLINELGDLLERTSQIDSLRQLLDEAAARGIAGARLPYLSASLALRSGDPAAAEALLAATPDRGPKRWHRLKAKVAEALGKPAAAFAAAQAMNQAQPDRDNWRARGARYRAKLRALAATLTPQWTARLPTLEPLGGQHPPIFLLGFPRSGTTLLDTFLMGHPALAVLEEYPLLQKAGAIAGPLAQLADAPVDRLAEARDAYLAERDRLLPAAHSGIAIDKFPLNLNAAPLIHCLFPDARIIFVQRHPCDAVLSGFMQAFDANVGMASFLDLGDAADFYDLCLSLWTASCDTLPLSVHNVVYEELVDDPEPVLRAAVAYLGLDWDEKLLDHRASAAARGFIPNTSYDQVTEPLSNAPVGRWRRYAEQLEPVIPILLPWARRLGYSDS